MARAIVLLLAVVSLAACGSSVAASGPAQIRTARCGPTGARTLAAGSQVQVYAEAGVAYGCANGSGTRTRLGAIATCLRGARVGVLVVAGRLVAYALQRCGVDTGETSIIIRRLPGGQTLFEHASVQPAGPESIMSVTGVVLGGNGQAAWIARSASILTHRSLIEVLRRAGRGVRLLDSGSGIGPGSLRHRGGQVSWTHGATRRSARLG